MKVFDENLQTKINVIENISTKDRHQNEIIKVPKIAKDTI